MTMVTGSRVTSLSGSDYSFSLNIALGMFASFVSCFVIGFLSSISRRSVFKPSALTFVYFTALGFVLIALEGSQLMGVGSFLMGWGLGCGYLAWGYIISRMSSQEITFSIALAYLLWGIASSLLTL